MKDPSGERPLQPDAEELILCQEDKYVCETYIFEPSPGEEKFGFMFAAGETEDRGGVGAELIDTIVTAIQREYYRDPNRSPSTSFEMALHQANLILHDAAEQGVRDWMGYFHMAIGVLVGNQLHLSVAGGAKVLLARKSKLSEISEGLSHFPITNPLQTFSQVASGDVTARDVLFFSSLNFDSAFRPVDVERFSIDHSAANISSRLKQLYGDQGQRAPLALITVSLLPQYVVHPRQKGAPAAAMAASAPRRANNGVSQENLRPRQPLVIHRTAIQKMFLFITQISSSAWQLIKKYLWPAIKHGSTRGGHALVHASKATGRNLQSLAQKQKGMAASVASGGFSPASLKSSLAPVATSSLSFMDRIKSLPSRTVRLFSSLPTTSKLFGVVSLLLLIALGVSVVFLQQKRTADADIKHASELLHNAQTKKDAAITALIYDNRDQARGLLTEAQALNDELTQTGLYATESEQLRSEITTQVDRLQRITRPAGEEVRIVADVSAQISGKPPTDLFFINDALYTANPDNNAIVKVDTNGSASVVRQTSQGTGFITTGATHESDKTITLYTEPAGVALFDSKDNTLVNQTIEFQSDKPNILGIAVFGNRLYTLDAGAQNIFVYNKTLRGYSSGSAWITDESAPKGTIKSFTIDGNIFTLHQDGSIQRFFKGALADYVQEKVEPSLTSATKIYTTETLQNLYVLDPQNKRVVVYSKKGALIKQIYIDTATSPIADIAINADGTKLYALDGTNILEVSLEDQPTS